MTGWLTIRWIDRWIVYSVNEQAGEAPVHLTVLRLGPILISFRPALAMTWVGGETYDRRESRDAR